MKKLLLSLGTLITIISPIVVIVSCESKSDDSERVISKPVIDNSNQNPPSNENASSKVTLPVDEIPDGKEIEKIKFPITPTMNFYFLYSSKSLEDLKKITSKEIDYFNCIDDKLDLLGIDKSKVELDPKASFWWDPDALEISSKYLVNETKIIVSPRPIEGKEIPSMYYLDGPKGLDTLDGKNIIDDPSEFITLHDQKVEIEDRFGISLDRIKELEGDEIKITSAIYSKDTDHLLITISFGAETKTFNYEIGCRKREIIYSALSNSDFSHYSDFVSEKNTFEDIDSYLGLNLNDNLDVNLGNEGTIENIHFYKDGMIVSFDLIAGETETKDKDIMHYEYKIKSITKDDVMKQISKIKMIDSNLLDKLNKIVGISNVKLMDIDLSKIRSFKAGDTIEFKFNNESSTTMIKYNGSSWRII